MTKWQVLAEPKGNNPGILRKAISDEEKLEKTPDGEQGENHGGVVLFLTNGSNRQEVCRVAWIRRNSKNPSADFKETFDQQVKLCRDLADSLNQLEEQFVKDELA